MNLLLVDDHPLILAALQAVIASFGNDDRVTCAQSAAQARERLREHPDVELVLVRSGDVLTVYPTSLSIPDMVARLRDLPVPPTVERRDETEIPERHGL
jgi:DNA-binding NarL/FixJ family response regulator